MERHAFAFPENLARSAADDLVICRCEGVTAGQIREAVEKFGVDELNRAKAISRVGMGRCQGRVCQSAAAEILAAATGRPIDAIGRLRGQAPLKPVSLRDLAKSIPV
jgi:bacterioferritin-associated ferredoxin